MAANLTSELRMLDGIAYQGLFLLPKHLRRAIDEETRVYTLEQPPKFFGKGKRPD